MRAKFYDIAMGHMVSPYKFDRENIEDGKKLHDFDEWMRDGVMSREDALVQLNRLNNNK